MACEGDSGAPKRRVFLVDDEPAVRRGLELLINFEPDLMVCGEAGGETEALKRIVASKPNLVVVDLGLKQGNGLSLVKQLRQRCPASRILVFSMHNRLYHVSAAFTAGAHGYVAKDEGTDKVLQALRVILRGSFYLSDQIAASMPGFHPAAGPTRRPRRAGQRY